MDGSASGVAVSSDLSLSLMCPPNQAASEVSFLSSLELSVSQVSSAGRECLCRGAQTENEGPRRQMRWPGSHWQSRLTATPGSELTWGQVERPPLS